MSTHVKGLSINPDGGDEDPPGREEQSEQPLAGIMDQLKAELERIPDAVGAILHGSHAQGDPREGSDVDLICVTNGDWFSKEIRLINDLEVEIQQIPEAQIRFDMEKMNKPFTVRAFANCRILFDRNGKVAALCQRAREKWKRGSPPPSKMEVFLGKSYLRHHLEELHRLVEEPEKNRAAIEGVLAETFLAAVRGHFRARSRWLAKTSAALGELQDSDPEFCALATQYSRAESFPEKISILEKMIDRALEPVGPLVVEYVTPRVPAQVFMLRGEDGAD